LNRFEVAKKSQTACCWCWVFTFASKDFGLYFDINGVLRVSSREELVFFRKFTSGESR
jgi:hypothetical protein